MLRIGIAYSLAPTGSIAGVPDDAFEEFDRPETIDALAEALRGLGYDPRPLGDGRALVESILADPPDLVFNIAEGQGTGRNRESRVPAFVELVGVPYTGSDPLTLAATLDKQVAKRLVRHEVATPQDLALAPELIVRNNSELRSRIGDVFHHYEDRFLTRVILKPALEGSSKGIRGRCVAATLDEAIDHFRELAKSYRQNILVEEYIEGDELTVGLLGEGGRARVLGSMRIIPKVDEPSFVYSLEVKRDWENRVDYESPARLDPATLRRLESSALAAYRSLGCRDVARIDFRVRPDGEPVFLEANPLPGLSPRTSDLVILAKGHGVSYEQLIGEIVDAALERAGLAGGGR